MLLFWWQKILNKYKIPILYLRKIRCNIEAKERIIIMLSKVFNKYKLEVRGIIHIGAHLGQEYQIYRKFFTTQPITWIEADTVVYERLKKSMEHDDGVVCINAAVSNKQGLATFHRANNEQSSSLLELGTHSTVHPNIVFTEQFTVETNTLDALSEIHKLFGANLMVLDVQGAEGMVIAGAKKLLKRVDYIYTEVNRDELYLGCTKLDAFDIIMFELGFKRVEIFLNAKLGWGNAFYIKEDRISRLRSQFYRFIHTLKQIVKRLRRLF